jgi:hypothetical protein
MQSRQIRRKCVRAAALLSVLAATGAGMTAAPATASASALARVPAVGPVTPDITPPLTPHDPIVPGEAGFQEAVHTCTQIGSVPNPVTGGPLNTIVCGEIYTFHTSAVAPIGVYVQDEAYCQQLSAQLFFEQYVACSAIIEQIGVGTPFGTAALPAQTCGVSLGHSACIDGRDLHAAFAYKYTPGSSAIKCEAWAEALRVTITLPLTGHPTFSHTVLATPPDSVFSKTGALGYCADT